MYAMIYLLQIYTDSSKKQQYFAISQKIQNTPPRKSTYSLAKGFT